MAHPYKRYEGGWQRALAMVFILMLAVLTLPGHQASAATVPPEGWYRLRTNSVPYQPKNVTLDSSGGLWLSAVDGSEYDPGVWYRPAASQAGNFQYLTNSRKNNLLGAAYNPPIEKPQLSAPVLHVIQDKGGNTWYALNNRQVLCEKADGNWLTFSMPDSSSLQPGVNTNGVDSAFRIRLIDNGDGSQDKLLIAMRGVLRVNAALAVVETRRVYQTYNNYFIRDALIDSQGRYWVTSEMGVEKGTSLVNTTYVKDLFPSDPAAATGTMITRMVEDAGGGIWFGSESYSGDGLYRYSASGQWQKYADGLVSAIGNKVHDIAAASDGSVWFGSIYSGDGGILRYVPANGGQWSRYTMSDLGVESGEIASLAADGAGLWFVTAYTPSVPGNGTGVHYLTLNDQGQPSVSHYTYRGNSTTLTGVLFNAIAADRSGGVWFPSYDHPSIARLKADGTWQQFRQAGSKSLGSFGISGVAADSRNRVYFAPLNALPVAYDVAAEQWLDLPAIPFGDFYYYGVYADAQDGIWWYGAFGVYYLDPDHSGWTRYSTNEIPQFPDDYVGGVLVDDSGNAWFMCRYGIALMKKTPGGGPPVWFKFSHGDASGYAGGYRLYQDDTGQVWNANSPRQKFNPLDNTWQTATDTSAFSHRRLRFTNGRVPVDMSLSGALAPITMADERFMTLDSRGTIYFSGGMAGMSLVNVGVVARGPVLGDIDRNGHLELADAVRIMQFLAGGPAQALFADVNGDGKTGIAEVIYILQKTAGTR